ncbi:multiple cyclophane-containing RiPP AmcA [Micromonospora pattaloongensis]|uniref:multiple cyclophane-containing RiPP AmcA n=1 Tax=Micromonospora pattaloongensis TaxID=405436 RepID=UPI0011153FF1
MTVYVSRHAFASSTGTPRPSASASVQVATGRATVSSAEPPLLTHVWQRVFAQRTGTGGQR